MSALQSDYLGVEPQEASEHPAWDGRRSLHVSCMREDFEFQVKAEVALPRMACRWQSSAVRHVQEMVISGMAVSKRLADFVSFWFCRIKHKQALRRHMVRIHIDVPQTCGVCGHISHNHRSHAVHSKTHYTDFKAEAISEHCDRLLQDGKVLAVSAQVSIINLLNRTHSRLLLFHFRNVNRFQEYEKSD